MAAVDSSSAETGREKHKNVRNKNSTAGYFGLTITLKVGAAALSLKFFDALVKAEVGGEFRKKDFYVYETCVTRSLFPAITMLQNVMREHIAPWDERDKNNNHQDGLDIFCRRRIDLVGGP